MKKGYHMTILLVFLVAIIFTNVAYAKTHLNTTTNSVYLKDKQVNPKTGEWIYKIDHISSIMTSPLVNKTIRYEVTPNSKIIVTNSKITSSYAINVSDPVNPVGYRLIPVNEQERITFGDKLANARPDLVFLYNIKGADKLSYYVTMLTSPPPKIVQDIINPIRVFFETGPKTAIMITDSHP
ncbi:MAG TPA: hypothetical protein VGC75_00580 [Candidatus Nitrosocosmicus sp.]